MSTRPGGVGQQGREPQHPAVDGDVVDLDPAFGQQFLDVAVGQAETQLPADGEDDDIGWEAEAGNGGPRSGSTARAAGSHTSSLTARTRSPPMQQSACSGWTSARVGVDRVATPTLPSPDGRRDHLTVNDCLRSAAELLPA